MNKIAVLLFFLILSVALQAQEIIVQSTNKEDLLFMVQYKNSPEIISAISKLKTVMNANPDYTGKNMNVVIKVTFRNPATNIINLKQSRIYSDIWSALPLVNTGNKIMLTFSFEEEPASNTKKFTFKNFKYEESGDGEQVPDVVAQYIKDQILAQENNDVEKIIEKGLNAVKNAFDRRFQQKMIEQVQKMLNCRYYYKGYSCITTSSYYFQNETIERESDLEQWLVYSQQNNYQLLYLKNWENTQAKVFDKLFGHELSLYKTPDASLQENLIYVKNGTDYMPANTLNIQFNTESLFDYTRTGLSTLDGVIQHKVTIGNDQIHVFAFADELKKAKNVLTADLSQYGQLKPLQPDMPVSHNTLYVLIKDKITGAGASADKDMYNWKNAIDNPQATELTDIQVWGHPAWKNKYQTWCNVFAQYLSHHVYGVINGDFLVPYGKWGKSANSLFDYFNGSPHYKKLPKDEKKDITEIWKLINKGYPVYFSKKKPGASGHIETGFPEVSSVNKYNKQNFFDMENRNKLLGGNQFVVGAGATVGFKSYDGYEWLQNTETKAFLALGYLDNVYE